MNFSEYVLSRWDTLSLAATEHAVVVGIAIAIATVFGVGIGLLAYDAPKVRSTSVAISAGILTVPSLALLTLLIPIFGLGWGSTLVSLTAYAFLPIIRNTVTGLRGLDAATVEAGRGMGLSRVRLLLRVQLPLAWPLILTGVRISAQMLIGIAAIAAVVDGPGLGTQIFEGLSRLGSVNSLNATLAGTLGIVVIAILFDLFFFAVRYITTPRGLRVRP
ncbi:ABC transporter permease [Nonomuraea sp. KC401]|uniref:ABC transporter permease n=1 Tax=Nonomuraea longispora TaxID=1848320 RepID=A0A4V2XKT7_9ACTN|nr:MULTISPECIES: ABC transporter permease [Nonomuraea]NBE94670.1 ABC transporter permease subunit [Nonomuraea sp. K271]TDC07746.1 ABC transporter permease [Nonomuraea longispora]TLF76144.1 ABC transporter permease [Nonomuraea sp. KC401]